MKFFTFLPFALGISIPTENSAATELEPLNQATFDHDTGRQRRAVINGCSKEEIDQYLNGQMKVCEEGNYTHEGQG